MTYWQVREVCEVGKEGRLFKLHKDEPLTVGRNNDCKLQLNLRTIDSKHAVVEWSNTKLSYIVRDLGSSSGTFVNNAPLTRGTEELRHGDSLRFGYEKTHVFRIEERYDSAAPTSTVPKTTSRLIPASISTQSSPQNKTAMTNQSIQPVSLRQDIPVSSLPATSVGLAQMPPSATHFIPIGQQGAFVTPGEQQGVMLNPGQQQGAFVTPGGQQGIMLNPGQQQGAFVTPGGQQGVMFNPGQQQGAFVTPGGQQRVMFNPRQQQGAFVTPGGQQGVMFNPGQQQGAFVTPGGQMMFSLQQDQQQGAVQSPMTYGFPQATGYSYSYPSSPTVSMAPQIQPAPMGHATVPSTPPPNVICHPPSHIDIESDRVTGEEPLSPKTNRSDGRRQIELGNSPKLATCSTLYGQPTWWGEENGKDTNPSNSTEFKHIRPGSQILRDLDYDPKPFQDDVSSIVSSTTRSSSRLSVKDELRLKAISNSLAQDQIDPSSSWVVDFGSGPGGTPGAKTRTPRFSSKQRPRSADHSPIRVSRRRDTSPSTADIRRVSSATTSRGLSDSDSSKRNLQASTLVKQKEVDPPVVRRTPHKSTVRRSPSPSVNRSATVRRSPSPSVTRSATVRRSPSPSVTRSATTRKTVPGSPRPSRVRRLSLDSKLPPTSSDTATAVQSKTVASDKTYTKFAQGSSDELQSSMSDLSLTSLADPVVVKEKLGLKSASESCVGGDSGKVCEGEDGKPGSPRKQWTNEKPQTPDSLMYASIEARMRRLSKVAQGAAVQLSSIKRNLQERGVVSDDSHTHHLRSLSPVADQHLPEWKFFNKEVDSIFRSIRSVERWLSDIDSSVSSMQPVSKGGVAKGEEGVDYETPTESEVEFFQDSIEDNFASCSDNYASD